MRTFRGLWVAMAALAVLCPAVALAGFKYTKPVYITAGRFEGTLGSSRNSSNTVEYIGCSVSGGVGTCSAKDSAGTTQSCTTTNATHLADIRAIDSMSFVQAYHTNGTCTTVYVSTYSYYAVPAN